MNLNQQQLGFGESLGGVSLLKTGSNSIEKGLFCAEIRTFPRKSGGTDPGKFQPNGGPALVCNLVTFNHELSTTGDNGAGCPESS